MTEEGFDMEYILNSATHWPEEIKQKNPSDKKPENLKKYKTSRICSEQEHSKVLVFCGVG